VYYKVSFKKGNLNMALTEEQRFDNKVRYLELLSELNFDMEKIIDFLERIDYFNGIFTSTGFGSYPGALCETALKLFDNMILLRDTYNIESVTREDIIKVALFRNFYKCALYEPIYKQQINPNTGATEEVLTFKVTNNRPVYGNNSFASYMLAKHFVDFTDDQILALCHGGFNEQSASDIYLIYESNPLVSLTHMADVATCYLAPWSVEKKEEPKKEEKVEEKKEDKNE